MSACKTLVKEDFTHQVMSFISNLNHLTIYNPLQNVFRKAKKLSEVRQDLKTLFCVIFDHFCKTIIYVGNTGHWVCPYLNLRFSHYILIF